MDHECNKLCSGATELAKVINNSAKKAISRNAKRFVLVLLEIIVNLILLSLGHLLRL